MAATIITTVRAIIGVSGTIAKTLNNVGTKLHEAYRNSTQWIALAPVNDSLQELLPEIESAVKCSTSRDSSMSSLDKGIINNHLVNIKSSLESANTILEDINDRLNQQDEAAQTKSTKNKSPFNFFRKKRRESVMHASRDKADLQKVKEHLENATENLKNVSILIQDRFGIFKAYFEPLHIPEHIYLDYDKKDGEYVSHEGLLKYKLLEQSNLMKHECEKLSNHQTGNEKSASQLLFLCVQGQGGMGKTTVLESICTQEDVKLQFPDGIHFLTIGENADDQTVINAISRCVDNAGFKAIASKVKEYTRVKEVVTETSSVFQDRSILLIVDDWHPPHVKYINIFRSLLHQTHNSAIVISTRFKVVSCKFFEQTVEFLELDSQGPTAKIILFKQMNQKEEDIIQTDESRKAMNSILEICGGNKLCLSIAGAGILRERSNCSSFAEAISEYAETLELNAEKLVTEQGESYDGTFKSIILTNLNYCNKQVASKKIPSLSDEIKEQNMQSRYLYEGLCIIEKQKQLPLHAIVKVWCTKRHVADDLVKEFSYCNLLDRIKNNEEEARRWGDKITIKMHDLAVDVCKDLAEEGEGLRIWHRKVLRGYLPSLEYEDRMKLSREDGSGMKKEFNQLDMKDTIINPKYWKLEETEYYFIENVCRFLKESEMKEELWNLVTNIEWTLQRRKVGGLFGLEADFNILKIMYGGDKQSSITLGLSNNTEIKGLQILSNKMREIWLKIRESEHTIGFEMFLRTTEEEKKLNAVSRYLKSIENDGPKPWLRPMKAFFEKQDSRQIRQVQFSSDFTKCSLSPDNCIIAFAKDNIISVFNLHSHEEVSTIQLQVCSISHIVISSKPYVIAACDRTGKEVHIVNAISGESIRNPLYEYFDPVTCIGIRSDGEQLLSGSNGGQVWIWDAKRDDYEGNMLTRHKDKVKSVAFSSEGKRVMSSSDDHTIRVCDVEEGRGTEVAYFGYPGLVTCMELSLDGKQVVLGIGGRMIGVFDVEKNEVAGSFFPGHKDNITCLGLSPDGKRIVSGSRDCKIRIWDTQKNETIGDALIGHTAQIIDVRFSLDGKRIISTSYDGTFRVWYTEEKTSTIRTVSTGRTDIVTCVKFSMNGKRVISGSMCGRIRVLDTETGMEIADAFIEENSFPCATPVKLSSDGKKALSVSPNGIVRVWDIQNDEMTEYAVIRHGVGVECVGFSSGERRIICGSCDGSVRVWDTKESMAIKDAFLTPLHFYYYPGRVLGRGSEKRLFGTSPSPCSYRVMDSTNDKVIGNAFVGEPNTVTCTEFSLNEKQVVFGSSDGTIRTWDTEKDKTIGEAFTGHTSCVKGVRFSLDGKRVISISLDNTIRVWDVRSKLQIGSELQIRNTWQWKQDNTIGNSHDGNERYKQWLNQLQSLLMNDFEMGEICKQTLNKEITQMLLRAGVYTDTSLCCDCNCQGHDHIEKDTTCCNSENPECNMYVTNDIPFTGTGKQVAVKLFAGIGDQPVTEIATMNEAHSWCLHSNTVAVGLFNGTVLIGRLQT